MSDLNNLPYAQWLEQSLQNIVTKPIQSICILTKFEGGDIGTGYYECSVADKLTFAGFLHHDAVMDSLSNDGYLEDDEEDDSNGEEKD